MRNIWRINREQSDHPKRNNFDLSFVSHSTFKFGYLYPVFKRKVYPGDSFQIDAGFDLKMMPVEFPVQSRMRAHMHFFYVKNKNLWKNWEDWIDGLRSNQECPHPYLLRPDTEFSNGSIHDFLNQPTSVVSGSTTRLLTALGPSYRNSVELPRNYVYPAFGFVGSSGLTEVSNVHDNDNYKSFVYILNYQPSVGDVLYLGDQIKAALESAGITSFSLTIGNQKDLNLTGRNYLSIYGYSGVSDVSDQLIVTSQFVDAFNSHSDSVVYLCINYNLAYDDSFASLRYAFGESAAVVNNPSLSGFKEWSEYASENSTSVYSDSLLLDALPYRAYEAIYRSFYANDVLQPLIKNGRKEYNKFVTNDDDGADATPYHLFRRNYEYDFLTSALPSPQAGPAPLVGMSALGEITVTDENGITTAQAVVDESTGKITDVTVTSPLASIEHGRTLMRMADVGMSINDFRNVNALTRLKERILRSGYRYKPFKKAIWGVDSSDDVLGMPEFIGGFSRDINISPIYSQANTMTFDSQGQQTGGDGLGDWAGVGRVVGGSEHTVSKFFDDYGWVIGVMSITPVPAYSQLLPKENLCPTNYLDYYFPDMAQLGMQPIPYSEVAPLQSYIDSLTDPSKKLTDVFGYQRPNYDMVGSVDEIHGEFRGSLRNMVINRIFDHRPELGSEFLEVNPSEINDIFINTNPDDDVFIGHLAFRIYPKRPLPRVHIPGLGF